MYNKVYACYGLEIFNNTPFKIFKQGARARCAGAGSAFGATYSESVTCHTANRTTSKTIYSKYKTYILILSSVICVNTFTPQILQNYVKLVCALNVLLRRIIPVWGINFWSLKCAWLQSKICKQKFCRKCKHISAINTQGNCHFLFCHTRMCWIFNWLFQKKLKVITAGSLGGAVLFIAGGLLLFQCIQVSTFAS